MQKKSHNQWKQIYHQKRLSVITEAVNIGIEAEFGTDGIGGCIRRSACVSHPKENWEKSEKGGQRLPYCSSMYIIVSYNDIIDG